MSKKNETIIKYNYIERIVEQKFNTYEIEEYEQSFLIHAILNTIEIKELITLFFNEKNSIIALKIESNIFKKFQTIKEKEEVYDFLYDKLKDSNYSIRQKVRKLLYELIEYLNISYIEDFFNTFYYSNYRNDKIAALKISNKIWRNEFSEIFIKEFLKTGEEQYLLKVLEFGDFSYFLDNLKSFWQLLFSNHLKNKIIKKFGNHNFNKFEFLKEKEADKYLLLLSCSNKKIKDSELREIFNLLPDESKVYGLLLLSNMNKWNLIEKEMKKIIFN